jgi:hypothetical protein
MVHRELELKVLYGTRYSDVISGREMMWCDEGRGAPYISLPPTRKMERGLGVATGLDGERLEGLKGKANIPHVWGITCHSHSLDIWCRHCKDRSL